MAKGMAILLMGCRHHNAACAPTLDDLRNPHGTNRNDLHPFARPLTLAALVLPQASILEVASTLDPLRSANRHLGREAFRWRVVSPDGAPVPLTCGIELPSTGPLAAAEGADALVVIAGFRQSEVATAPLIRDLARMAPRFAAIGGIDAGRLGAGAGGVAERPPGHRALGGSGRFRRSPPRRSMWLPTAMSSTATALPQVALRPPPI